MTAAIDGDEDEFQWLEDLDAERAATWVRDRNAETVDDLATGGRFAELRTSLRQVLDADDRIPEPVWRGEFFYNFWQDAAHPRGLWRRTTIDQYRRADPDWQVLIDIDELAAAEGENWAWEGAAVLRPGYERALVQLSRGGADAVVVREFDLRAAAFVTEGFVLPEAKTRISWIDADHIYVGTDFGPGSLTTSGYPRSVKRWRRGTPLAAAELIFEGGEDDVVVHATHDPTPGFERDFARRRLDFYRAEEYLITADGRMLRIEVPPDALCDVHREWLLVRPRSAWTVGATTYPAGSLLVADFDAFLAGERELTVLFAPDERTSLQSCHWTRHQLILTLLQDVTSRLAVLTPTASGWASEPLSGLPESSQLEIVDTDPDHGDGFLLRATGFLRPPTLLLGPAHGLVEQLKQEPTFFDAERFAVRQFFAISDDGTRVPYFVVRDPAAPAGPALLDGYGGFEVSMTPRYSGCYGRAWLARGGTYVLANIRGGGEYGPAWHQAALRERRPRAFEDFAAVAADLVTRGFTTPDQLGAIGGSNGGLLMGVMLTRYPQHFGAIVARVPLLDMRRYHQLLAGASWMAEYGNPDDGDDWSYLHEYSPYHNVRAGRPYPPVLFVTSTRDDRVHPAHARKMAARLREHGLPVSYYENVDGGHSAATDNEQYAFILALTMEFLWRRLSPSTGSAPQQRSASAVNVTARP